MSKATDNIKYIDHTKNNKSGKLAYKFFRLFYFKNTQNSLDNVIMDLQT